MRFFSRVLDDVRALPGVRSASVTSAMPVFSFDFVKVAPEGERVDEPSRVPTWANTIDDRYFETMGIPLLAGRTFTRTDDASAPRVAIVNDTFARRAWPGADPIGKRVRRLDTGRELHDIVGVVKTSTYGIPGELPQDAIYFPFGQQRADEMVLLAQTAGDSAAMLEPLRDLVQSLDRDVPIGDLQTIETFYSTRVETFGTHMVRLVGGMGVMGVLLTMVGLYGLVSYAVSRRTREIGIRIAIGASSARIVKMILRQGMAPAWAGLIAGLLLSVVVARLMTGLVPFFAHRVDAHTYYIVVPILIAILLAASFVPARRAAAVDPTTALRSE